LTSPHDELPQRASRRRSWPLVVPTILLAWLSFLFGSLSFVAVPAFVGVLVWLARRRRWLPMAALLLTSPFAVAAVFAVASYVQGNARLQTEGMPSARLENVDPDTGYKWDTSGCMVSGGEWVLHVPYNATLSVLRLVFGPMRGAYAGPVPDEAEVEQALQSATPLRWTEFEHDTVTMAGRYFRLRPGIGAQLASRYQAAAQDACCPATVALWRERVVILRLLDIRTGEQEARALLVLIDGNTGKVLAYRGRIPAYSRALPRQWA